MIKIHSQRSMRIRKRCPPSSIPSTPQSAAPPPLVCLSSRLPPPPPTVKLPNFEFVTGINTLNPMHHKIHGSSNSKQQPEDDSLTGSEHLKRSTASPTESSSVDGHVQYNCNPNGTETSTSAAEQKLFPFKKKRTAFDEAESIKKENEGKKAVLRCTRSNGSGRRGMQPPLKKGFAMCQHHFHQARVRYSLSVDKDSTPRRIRTASTCRHGEANGRTSGSYVEEEHDDELLQGCKTDKRTKVYKRDKQRKVGVVKARTISSLLAQTVPLP